MKQCVFCWENTIRQQIPKSKQPTIISFIIGSLDPPITSWSSNRLGRVKYYLGTSLNHFSIMICSVKLSETQQCEMSLHTEHTFVCFKKKKKNCRSESEVSRIGSISLKSMSRAFSIKLSNSPFQ